MTCREKLKIEHPEYVGSIYIGGCQGCPYAYGYLDRPEFCVTGGRQDICSKCWDREIPETEKELVDKIAAAKVEVEMLKLELELLKMNKSILNAVDAFKKLKEQLGEEYKK